MLMEFKFNSYDIITPPKIALCRIDTQMIGYLQFTNLVIKPTFCSLSEVTFKCYKDTNLYDCIRKHMTLVIDGFGRFVIDSFSETDDGQNKYKEITAYSYESTMNNVTLTYKEDTVFKLFDVIEPEKTLLGIIQSQTGWIVKEIDSSLLNKIRTMNIDNEQAYGLLVGDIAETFKCYFVFDTMNKYIYCYDRDEVERPIKNSGINLSFRNLINEVKVNESSDDIITALTVTGAEGVGINVVNPLGNNIIYDFSYYCNDYEWGIPKDIQIAISEWNNKIESKKPEYEALVGQRKRLAADKVALDGELKVLEGELKSLQDVQSVNISANNTAGLEEDYVKIRDKESEISNKKSVMSNVELEYNICVENINAIVQSLSFANNFTTEQYNILKYYINGSVYENENFVYTTNMTEDKRIEMSQQLYDQGKKVMDKLSKPLYEYECDISAFMFSKEYEEFTKSIELGAAVNVEVKPGVWSEPRLMQLVIDYDNPDNTTAILSDSFRLINDVYTFSNDYTSALKASRKSSLSAPLWDEPNKSGFYTTVNDYINNALNLANQEIINATNQEFTLGSYGLRGKKYDDESDTYDPHQIAMTNNVLAFTDDDWHSCRTALGRITIGETEYYGLVAEAIVGELIAGDQLTILNENNSFKVDGNGATLNNASFTIEKDNTKIVISPDEGFSIKKKNGSIWDDVLTEDIDGNIVANSIKLATGDIGGWTIERDRLSSPVGDYIASDGTGKLSLLRWNNSAAWFDGNIYANNLSWRYGDGDYKSIFSSNGYMSGGWLGNGSVGIDKRLVDEWDELYANKIVVDELIAKSITVDNLAAGFIEAEGIKTELMFGGKFYVCDTDNINNNAQIYGYKDNISSEIQNVYCMAIRSTGNISLEPGYGDVLIKDKRLYAGSVTANGLTVNGESNFNNDISISDKYIKGRVGFKDGDVWFENGFSTYNGDVNFYSKVRFSGEVVVHQNDRDYAGASATIYDKDGLKVEVRNGIITHIGH